VIQFQGIYEKWLGNRDRAKYSFFGDKRKNPQWGLFLLLAEREGLSLRDLKCGFAAA